MSDTAEPGYVQRRDDVRQMFKQTSTPLPEGIRREARQVAARVFGLEAKTAGPVAVGEPLGPYRVVRLLGMGGQACVYEAEHAQLGRRVAIKVPRRDVSERLLAEARMAARLEHAGVVRVEDIGEHEGATGTVPYLVMEVLPGGSLDHLLEEHPGGLPLREVRRIGAAILEALGYAHSQGVVHRDVKPANVLFDESRRPKLTDFGIGALSARAPDLDHSIEESRLTGDGAIGTPLFMAPEQEDAGLLQGAKIDGRADLFSFGKLLFLMLTGASPRTIRPPSRLRPGLDPAWDELVFKLVEEDRELRPASAEEVLAALERIPAEEALRVVLTPTSSDPHPDARGEEGRSRDPGPAVRVTERGKVPVGVIVFPEKVEPGVLVSPKGRLPGFLFGLLGLASAGLAGYMGWLTTDVDRWTRQELLPLTIGAGLAALLLWAFRRGEQRAQGSIGAWGALFIAALVGAWQPALFLGRFADVRMGSVTYKLIGLPHHEFVSLGAGLCLATLVLGLVILIVYRTRRRPPPRGGSGEGPVVRAVPRNGGAGGVLLRMVGFLAGLLALASSVALAVVVLLGAGLVALAREMGADPGVDPAALVTASGLLLGGGTVLGLVLSIPSLVGLLRRLFAPARAPTPPTW